jgi:hypothetical protein
MLRERREKIQKYACGAWGEEMLNGVPPVINLNVVILNTKNGQMDAQSKTY